MKRTLVIILALFIFLQFFPIDKNNPKSNSNLEIKTNPKIQNILKKACYDCHSNSTLWPPASYVAPLSWIISSHVKNGRKALNFSLWNSYTKEEQEKELKQIYKKIYASMPMKSYILMHEEADITKDERNLIREWTGGRR